MSYVQEKLYEATSCLVTEGPLRKRLADAATILFRLEADDFPDGDNAKAFERIYHDLTHVEAVPGDEGNTDATTKRLSDEDARRIAIGILGLYHRSMRGD